MEIIGDYDDDVISLHSSARLVAETDQGIRLGTTGLGERGRHSSLTFACYCCYYYIYLCMILLIIVYF